MNQSLVLFSCVCSWWLLACVSLTRRRLRVSMTSRFGSSSDCFPRHVSGIGMSMKFRFSCSMALPTSTRYYRRDGRAAQQESINQGSKAQQVFERASELWTVWKIYRRFEIRPSRWNQRFAPIGQDQHKPQLALTIGMPQNLQ